MYRRKRAVFGWILIWDENIVAIDTRTMYFVNKSAFQYKISVVRGRDIDFFSAQLQECAQKPQKSGRQKKSATAFGLKSKKISNIQELIQSDPISCPQNQKGNN